MRAYSLAFLFAASLMGQTANDPVVNRSFETFDPAMPSQAYAWKPYGMPYLRATVSFAWDGQNVAQFRGGTGAVQRITFNQQLPEPILISVRVKGDNIQNVSTDNVGMSLDCRVQFKDGTANFCPKTALTKGVGTFGWDLYGFNTWNLSPSASTKLVDWIEVRLTMAQINGLAFADDVHAYRYPHKLETQNGLVTVVFDDSLLSTYTKAYPLMKSYGFCGTAASVWNYLFVNDGKHMTLGQLKDLVANCWSNMSHTMNHKNLKALADSGEIAALNYEIAQSHQNFITAGIPTRHLATPYGAYNRTVQSRAQAQSFTWNGVRYKYDSVRNTDRDFNPRGVYPYNVNVQSIDKSIDSSRMYDQIVSWLNTARTKKSWLILMVHEIDNPYNDPYNVTSRDFELMLGAIKNSGIPVVTYDRGFQLMTAKQ